MNKLVFLILILAVFTACQKESTTNRAGGDIIGNGGDNLVLEFKQLAREGLDISKENSDEWPEIDFKKLDEKIKSADVVSTDKNLFSNNEQKDAVNLPAESKIYVNRNRWNAIPNRNVKRALVFHEYLGLLQIDDLNYTVSSQLLNFDPITFVPLKKRVDILVVVDNSGSMNDFQMSMSKRIHSLIESIEQQNINYHIGVISTDNDNEAGRLLGSVAFVTPNTPDGLKILSKSILLGTYGSGMEMAMTTTLKALSTQMTCKGCPNEGFLRRSAHLEIITLSDADDNGTTNPADIATNLRAVKIGSKAKVSITSFLPIPGDINCKSAERPPVRLIEVITLLDGNIRNLCASDSESEYKEIAAKILLKTENL